VYFKRLEIQGFKSFVDYSSLDFEPGVTAIVGPNGCGKSNVVDSLRWVLGEQSAKALRGSRMEDVIFNGTDQRKAVGMAEVSLTINNDDHLLPTEHNEITVTRRTFRSGESEYLINKAPCRLRDIHDLFMDTGIGTNAYSILEQGKIDLIVSSRAADRRFVFEEAAGISKYKSRKEESLRKLEATDQNFLRVNDIAVEVKRQIGSLERQVQKARRYQELKQELTTLEVSQGRRELLERRRALRKVEHEWEERSSRLEEHEAQKRGREAELFELLSELQEAETGLARLQGEAHRVTEEIIKAEDFISSSDLRTQDLTQAIERMRQELAEQDSKEEQLRSQNSGILGAKDTKEQELLQVKQELSGEEARLGDLEMELKERAARVQDQQGRLLKIVDQMSTLRNVLKNLEMRRMEHEQQVGKYDQRLANFMEQEQEAAREKASWETDLSGIHTTLDTLRQEREHLAREKERLENSLETLTSMVENFNKTITQLGSRLAWIEELKNGLDGYDLGAKSILLAHNAEPEKFPGIIGPVVNFIRTDPDLEFAFEALLGHKLQYILVQTEEQSRQAMAYLAAENRGRATFIPLEYYPGDLFQKPDEGSKPAWMEKPGCLGWAKDLVRVDERFRGVFNHLLRNVAVMENAAAVKAARDAGATCSFVTLAGDVDSEERWLTGGSQDIMERGLMGREREIEELKAELDVLEKNLAESQHEMERTKTQLEETVGSLETNGSELHELEIRAAQLAKSLEGVSAQMQEIQRQFTALQDEREQILAQLQETATNHTDTSLKLAELEQADRETQDELAHHQYEIEERRKEYDQRSSRAGELRVASAAFEQQLNSLLAETERIVNELTEMGNRRQERQGRMTSDQERLNELTQQVGEKQTQLTLFSENRQTLESTLETQRQEREILGEKKKQLESGARESQAELDEMKQVLHRLELEKAQLKMNLQSQESYLEEEYHLNCAEETAEPEATPAAGEPLPDPADIHDRIKELKNKISGMGSVNLVAVEEYDELQQRYTFLSKQLEDLKEAKDALQRLIVKINQESQTRFSETFAQVRVKFREVFRRLFNGGDADLVLVDETNLLESGIEIIARPPGKRLQNITLLSGGEKAMTAIALLFAIFLIKPSPFCIFDEMDAPLDDVNTSRFSRILREFAQKSQFIVITHNKITMEAAGVLYGVTMQESGISKLISVKLRGEEERLLEPLPPSAEEVIAN
jgi:chromosome segregation protein